MPSDLEEKLTINDAERLIQKMEACSGMPAKLLILKQVAALGRAEGLALAEKEANYYAMRPLRDVDLACDAMCLHFEEGAMTTRKQAEQNYSLDIT